MTGIRNLLFIVLTFYSTVTWSQSFKFAQVTDTHVGGSTGALDLRLTVQDLNQQKDLDFVILSGDITEFGSDEEFALAKQILDSLNLPLYILPGNHDSNWSESGANSFRKFFGSETFFFKHKGFAFIGTTSGPNMRMSPGQIPRENLVWMDSILRHDEDNITGWIAINHYPLDSSLNNWFEKIDRLKTRNIQLAICGHGHQNKLYDWEGIPGVMTRSNLRAKEEQGGYNIVTIQTDSAFFQVRRPLVTTEKPWLKVALRAQKNLHNPIRPNYAVNNNKVETLWEYQDHGDIGVGITTNGKLVYSANTIGEVYALDLKTGKRKWTYQTGGKIYSTPGYADGIVVVGSSDHFIYGLNAKNGKLIWKAQTKKAVLGSPAIDEKYAYIGASDGIFRCIDIYTGKIQWEYKNVKGYVSTLPTIAEDKVLFGSWENGFYALDKKTGTAIWTWDNSQKNRMFSPAACYPIVANNRVFIVAPDRYMTALDLETGKQIWREKKDPHRVRESIGSSIDKKLIYAKTMDGQLIGVSTQEDEMNMIWTAKLQLPYEIAPTNIVTMNDYILVPSHSGLVSCVHSKTGDVIWQYKVSNAMINPILPHKNTIVISTMDGKIVRLKI